jgi:hypothetical protein
LQQRFPQTLALWEQLGGRGITDEDGRQIATNLTGFFRLLQQWAESSEAATSPVEIGYRSPNILDKIARRAKPESACTGQEMPMQDITKFKDGALTRNDTEPTVRGKVQAESGKDWRTTVAVLKEKINQRPHIAAKHPGKNHATSALGTLATQVRMPRLLNITNPRAGGESASHANDGGTDARKQPRRSD